MARRARAVLGRRSRATDREPTSTRLAADAQARGGVGGIALTHGHGDHTDGVAGLLARVGDAPVAAAAWDGATVRLADGDAFGPLQAIATPGHAPDHLAFLAGRALFSGRRRPRRTAASTSRPTRARCAATCARSTGSSRWTSTSSAPATGPWSASRTPSSPSTATTGSSASAGSSPRSTTACARPTSCSTGSGRTCPSVLRPAAAVTLAAHLDKLEEEGRLPPDVDRGTLPRYGDARS